MKPNLTFKDGFYFGCGFFVAGLVYAISFVVILSLVLFLLAAAGFSSLPR